MDIRIFGYTGIVVCFLANNSMQGSSKEKKERGEEASYVINILDPTDCEYSSLSDFEGSKNRKSNKAPRTLSHFQKSQQPSVELHRSVSTPMIRKEKTDLLRRPSSSEASKVIKTITSTEKSIEKKSWVCQCGKYAFNVALLVGAFALGYVAKKLYGGCEEMQSDCDVAKELMVSCNVLLNDTLSICGSLLKAGFAPGH